MFLASVTVFILGHSDLEYGLFRCKSTCVFKSSYWGHLIF